MVVKQTIRIGGGAGFWGDSPDGPAQLVRRGNIDYLILDYLAEITMSILARAKARNPKLGYATDFVTQVIGPLATELAAKKIKVVANAGGCNPLDCCAALERELAGRGVKLRVAAVIGDDVVAHLASLAGDVREMATGEPLPAGVLTANAYLGAFPIAAALSMGADIVVTGRCADSALALAPMIHEFGWKKDDWDLLAAGSLAGHVIECGCQATGGYATDWKDVASDWSDMGFPIAVCRADGTFSITKPPGTGGAVNYGTIAEQVTYETGDPRSYILPDVVCDLGDATVHEIGPEEVEVRGVHGKPATPTYKVSATIPDGFRCLATLFVKGIDADRKARAMGEAILGRARRLMLAAGFADYTETSIEVLGAEDTYGPHAEQRAWREVMLKVAARHRDEKALDIMSREIYPSATAMAQGIGGIFGGRPKVQPVMRLYSFLVDKTVLPVSVEFEGTSTEMSAFVPVSPVSGRGSQPLAAATSVASSNAPSAAASIGATTGASNVASSERTSDNNMTVRLIDLAYARSGDKGDSSNIAVIARRPKYLNAIAEQLTADAVADYMAHVAKGPVQRFDWPGLHGFNFLLERALGGGGVSSLRYDPQGKGHAQMLLEFPIRVPASWNVVKQ